MKTEKQVYESINNDLEKFNETFTYFANLLSWNKSNVEKELL